MAEFSLEEFHRGQPLGEYVRELPADQPDLPVLLAEATLSLDVVDQFRATDVRYAAVITEPWCPDSLHAIPLLVRLDEALPELEINVWKRSADVDLACRIGGEQPGARPPAVPHIAFRDADFRELGRFRERPAPLTAHLEEESRHFRTRLRMQERDRVRAETRDALLAAARGGGRDAGAELDDAIAAVRAALARLVTGSDPAPIKALYSHAPDATGFFGWGGYVHGWEQLDSRWDWAAAQFAGGEAPTYESLTRHVAGDLAVTVDVERTRVSFTGATDVREIAQRVTHVYRRESGAWRLVHRHADALQPQIPPGTPAER